MATAVASTILLLLLCSHSLAANNTLIQGGPSLNSSAVLVSPNGRFSLGFRRAGKSSGRYLGIWCTNETSSYLFWIANRGFPIPDDSGSLSLDRNGTLKITYSGGRSLPLYSSDIRRGRGLTAVLEDTGSFSVRDAEDWGNAAWQSLDSPTDTWVQGMKLGVFDRGQTNRKLTSWLTDSIPAQQGAFTLEWDPAVEELVMKLRGIVFWTSGKQLGPTHFPNANLSSWFPAADSSGVSVYRVSNPPDEDYLTFNTTSTSYFSFWRLTSQGTIGIQAGDGTPLSIVDTDSCYGNVTRRAGCRQELQDPDPDCRRVDGLGIQFRYGTFRSRPWVDNNASISIADCKERCWRDCECGGISVDGSDGSDTGCKFFSYRTFVDLPGSRAILHYVVLRESDAGMTLDDPDVATYNNPSTKLQSAPRYRIWVPVAVAAGVLVLLVICILCYLRRRKPAARRLGELMGSDSLILHTNKDMEDDGSEDMRLKVYNVASIIKATDNFSVQNKLGQGGFGPVYKGKLPEGLEIAVKRLSKRSSQGMVEFQNELLLISRLQHTNLVRLLGCCVHGEEKMLVYEYMPNKSLDTFIFDTSKRSLMLDWNKSFSIIEGIAQGLSYLHQYSRVRIIHRDLKASNILLDENMNPKISDFGMARMFNTNALEANTNRVVGTYGYMSPEYAMEGTFSTKSDVFSFGVLLLEIVSGKKNYGLVQLDPPINLVGYAWKLWKEGTPFQLMDPTLKEDSSNGKDQILRCIHLALLCIERSPSDRPTMSEVISMLTNEVTRLPTVKQPAFTMTRPRSIGIEGSSNDDSRIWSTNEVTITTLSPR